MIDENKLIDHLQRAVSASDNSNFTNGLLSAIDIVKMQPKVKKWIPISEKLPENEKDVEITYTKKHWKTGEALYFTARAFYTDGIMTTEDSDYNWNDYDYQFNWEYSEEKDAYFIPEGWWESVCFGEEFSEIADEVIAWRPLSEPYKPNRH